ncbi:MAG TPA: RsmE family RNA methyltransferase [Candidatus Paceibacterota bacterium]|nr:RsmE family RNA methyltransferase [Candidatus Paceibacterota bacterium]
MTKLHRFIGPWQLAHGNVRLDDADLAHQMRSVLKLKAGETVILGDGTGQEAHCSILSYERDAVVVQCNSIGRNAAEPQAHLVLYCAVLKHEHFELAAGKVTEIGARSIVPVITARTVKLNLRTDRVERIVREAAELAGRGLVPEVRDVMTFDQALSDAHHNDANLFLDPEGKPLDRLGAGNRKVGIFIGPEGGWDENEKRAAHEYGMRIISLGPLVMRAETAAVVAAYLTLHTLRS